MHKKILLAIILLAALVRLYDLAHLPNSISADEAAFAYNAYSLLKTGADEFGTVHPWYFRSFDDYKNPVFGYTLIPFIAVFGLEDFAIRFPSALSGIAVVYLSFLLTKQLTRSNKTALLTALFAAICPWLIQYSRVAIEMELALVFSLAAVWCFLKGEIKNRYYFFSAILFALSFYTYHSSKVWVIGFGFFLLCWTKKISRKILLCGLLFVFLTIPYFVLLKTSNIGLRPYAISVFSKDADAQQNIQLITEDKVSVLSKLFHNRRLLLFNQATTGFLGVLNPQILFTPTPYNHPPLVRLLYLWQLPLIAIGIYALAQTPSVWLFFLVWTVLGFLPAAVTILPPFDRRMLLSSYPLLVFASSGTIFVWQKIKCLPKFLASSLLCICCVLLFISISMYLHIYFIHGKTQVLDTWGNGTKQLVEKVAAEKSKYTHVIVSIGANQPLTYFLYYTKYPPEKYLKEGGTITGGFLEERNRFDIYQFRNITLHTLAPDTLYIWHARESQPCLKKLETFYLTDGTPSAYAGIYDPTTTGCHIWLETQGETPSTQHK